MNMKALSTNKSGYKGAYWHESKGKWISDIKVEGKKIHLGAFDTKEEAALAYNEGAIKYFGEFARLNVVEKAGAADAD